MSARKITFKRVSLISTLALCSGVFAVVMIGIPMVKTFYRMNNPEQGMIDLALSPVACADLLMDRQDSLDPCRIKAHYAFDPVAGELVIFVGQQRVRVRNWQRDVTSIEGRPFEPAALPLVGG